MGSCRGAKSEPQIQDHGYPPIPQQQEEDDHHNIITTTSTTRRNTPFLGTPDRFAAGAGSSSPSSTTEPSFADPRMLSLLEFFRQLYVRRKDVFKRIIPVHHEAFEEIFNKMRMMQQEDKFKRDSNMKGMLRQRSMSFGKADEVRLKRFKVKPIDSGGTTPPDGGGKPGDGGKAGGGGATPGGSK